MKMLGLIGGMSWESSAHYYRLINQGVRKACGATASARLLLWSFNFAEIEALQHSGQWLEQEALLVEAARRLEAAGAQVLLICSNTMHKLAQNVEQAVAIPLLHIADPSAQAAAATGIVKVGLLGTSFTMEQDFSRIGCSSMDWTSWSQERPTARSCTASFTRNWSSAKFEMRRAWPIAA